MTLVAGATASSGSLLARAGAWLAGAGAAERDRLALWAPVALGIGVIAYFALPAEPPELLGAALASAALAGILAVRRRPSLILPIAALALAAVGFALAEWRTARVAAPMLDRDLGPRIVEGRVVAEDVLPGTVRVVLDDVAIEEVDRAATPARVRIRLRSGTAPLPTGARIRVLAILGGPSGPAAPGAYDFRRQAFFERLGGVGFAIGEVEITAPPQPGGLGQAIERLRQRVGARIRGHLEGDEGAMAEALLTGARGGISEEVNEAMRLSGLAHLLSISGLHIGLVAAIVFGGVRGALALWPAVALRWPVKKWAAVVAVAAILFYTLIVGATVPTQRAFLMTGLVFAAILVDRSALSLRVLAWAAIAVMALSPESLLGPSFQMSFAAVLGLIAGFEAAGARLWRREGDGWIARAGRSLAAMLLTSLIASAATAPFALYHFQRISLAGILSNLLAVPLTGFWITPFGILAYLLMPFGLEGLALEPMAWGIDALIWIARTAAAWPLAAVAAPAMTDTGLALAALGCLWLCLWRGRHRLLGAPLVLVAMASGLAAARPDLLINDTGTLIAIRDEAGRLALSSGRADRFARDVWLRREGQEEAARWADAPPDGALACDGLACLWRRQGHLVALVTDRQAAGEDCARADVVVASVPMPRWCGAGVVVDRFDLWREGAHALYIGPDGVRLQSVADAVGDRPWSLALARRLSRSGGSAPPGGPEP
jgi:competence protein ComEC